MQQLKMEVFDSKIASNIDLEQEISRISAKEFLRPDRGDRSRLIWCHEADVESFKSAAIDIRAPVKLNHQVVQELRELKIMDILLIT